MLPAAVTDSIRLSLERAERILVISHIGPDGDAIASLTATGLALTQLGKRFTLVCDDGLPERFKYLPMSDRISSTPQPDAVYDLIIALDASDESRLGNAYAALPPPQPAVINIDHHITNTNYGAINLVQPEATATVEVLFELFVTLNLRLDESMAICLLSGLVTDTLGFRTAGVSSRTLQIASQLVEAGANLYEVITKALTLM
ncbi:MAG: DHH family phosphoesterase, partial [Candidatus Promineifilaceae bacterium]